MKRQGLNISVNELRKLADELESEIRQFNLEFGVKEIIDFNKRWLINIINEKPNCSDTWTLEFSYLHQKLINGLKKINTTGLGRSYGYDIPKTKNITKDYDKENDIWACNWGKVDNSRELFNDKVIIDFDKKAEVVGFEIFDFMKELNKGQKKLDRIFKDRISQKTRDAKVSK